MENTRTFEIDINGRYAGIVAANNEKEAMAKAEERYPEVKNSIQLWEIGGNH